MLANPRPGTVESHIIEKLRNEHMDRAELFYLNAKSLNDPLTGFEDADFWSVQALLLMAIYMLAKSKRNTAFALLGMAVRSAYALGLHREETMIIFSAEDQTNRKNLWKSLFVVDRFLSCSLGRPAAISEDDCSGDTLKPGDPENRSDDFGFNAAFQGSANFSQTAQFGLEAAVRSCSVIGTILKRVYQQRKISTKLAQEIADVCKVWPKALAPMLHWRQASSASPSQGIAILHVNLFYCHSIILLTRPFFLFILNAEISKGPANAFSVARSRRNYNRMEKFSEACVIASTHTVVLVWNAFEAGYLPRRNPTVVYFLFAAALILLSNEFAVLYVNNAADQCVRNAITVMAYCAETDPQASRLLYILSTFRDVVVQQRERRVRQQQQANQLPPVHLKPHINPYGPPSSFSPTATTHTIPQLPSLPANLLPHSLPSVTSVPNLNGFQPPGQQRTPPTSMDSPSLGNLPNIAGGAAPPNRSSPPLTAGSPHTTHPIEPALTPSAPHNPLSPSHSAVPGTPSDPRQLSLSTMLDYSALGAADRMSLSEEGSMPDEHIDFDALWAWPSNTPAMGTPHPNTGNMGLSGGAHAEQSNVQSVSDSTVPLFGVLETESRLNIP
jgi:Fungal specific transcription factor domain